MLHDTIPPVECLVDVDRRGVERPSGSGCEPGAFELGDIAPTPTPGPNPVPPIDRGVIVSLSPERLLETRSGDGVSTVDGRHEGVGRVGAGSVVEFQVAGRGGVPSAGVAAAVLNVAVVGAGGPGHITVFPCGERPIASAINYTAPGAVIANEVVARLSPSGSVCVFTHADTDLIADIVGYVQG